MKNLVCTAGLLAIVVLAAAASRSAAADVPIVYSSDLYHPHEDPDDHFDLATLFSLDELDIRGIILDGGQRQLQAPGKIPVEQMFKLAGRKAPYAIGLAQRLASPGDKAQNQPAQFQGGVQLILDALRRSPKKVRILTTGSLRDVAAAFNREPKLMRDKVDRLYIVIGDPGVADQYEYNVQLDPQSYARVLESGLPIYWCPCFDGGVWKRDHGYATYWQFTQGDVLQSAPPRLQSWFGYALMRLKGADPIAYLDLPLQGDQQMQIWPTRRNMWSTAALLDAAGRQIYERTDGSFAALRPQDAARQSLANRKVEAFRFDPVAVTVASNDSGKLRLKVDLKPPKANMRIFRVSDPRYQQIMTDCLAQLLSGLGK